MANAPPGFRWSRAASIACEREQVALQAERRLPADQRQRVGQGEQDQVVGCVGLFQEGAAVIDVDRYARILVGVIRVQFGTDLLQLRIDLDGVDVLGALRQGDGDIAP